MTSTLAPTIDPHAPADSRARASHVTARAWFATGTRVPYDPAQKRLLSERAPAPFRVFLRELFYGDAGGEVVTFLPGYPFGSFDFAAIDRRLEAGAPMNRIFVEYLGQGDSDKPKDHPHSTFGRADLIEAIWAARGIEATQIVSLDYSSLVVMELMARQQRRLAAGEPAGTRITRALLVNGGYFVDGHSHPLTTTPLLQTVFGRMFTRRAARSLAVFRTGVRAMWSRDYALSDIELAEVHEVLTRRDGISFMNDAAGFVREHKKVGRWDLRALYAEQPDMRLMIAGSVEDVFEPRQFALARERLAPLGAEMFELPGGHCTNFEHPSDTVELVLRMRR